MKLAILFPGQGSQYIGMCGKLIKEFSDVDKIFREANEIMCFDIRSMILDGRIEELTLSQNAQPAVVIASYALFRVFEHQTGVMPSYAVGHSLGEISALIAAGSLSFEQGLSYVGKRGRLMHRAMEEKRGRSGIVTDMELHILEGIIESIALVEYITISGYNSPRQFIVAGTQAALKALDKEADKHGAEFIPFRMIPMKADAPYHSELMTFIRPELREALNGISFKQPKFNIWSTVTGRLIDTADSIPGILGSQLVLPVLWNQSLKQMCNAGVELLVDIGPQVIMRNLIRENPELPETLAFEDEQDAKKILEHIKRG
ncbi:[acyl-carrier-protein] S-malonyltransferase [Anaerobacterium chartisolvens]|uniref:Malonyl CoA-acyl carrier protein transacylase n=1 Tax=Anaerobacterium chartisolvens TaxID=1297424 RepID=A0A369BGC5_9FIRM|nr:ACP S-malonyltransferase [Anaerobacterium chartisolvens]RCX18744.1 [acyl-carrier-protein] S-malonyltransferase [Anaerobacterium chartisolvens]